jgi:hypothetical protein
MMFAFVFNLINTYIQARWIFVLAPAGLYSPAWLRDWRFISGIFLFYAGYIITKKADGILRSLRGPGESGYKMPRGWLFKYVSCPNYLGEIIEWTGWALAVWSLPGAVFLLWTLANLVPRARSHHVWYNQTFPEYPKSRRALIPYLF